jgi:predicted MPP superfamily phosphohydrolase
MLHHAPNGIKYAAQAGVDLYLAGHTHAGQIFPFNYLANLIFEYNRGLHEYNGTYVYVSEGVGTFGPPFRLGTKSEIISMQLVPK